MTSDPRLGEAQWLGVIGQTSSVGDWGHYLVIGLYLCALGCFGSVLWQHYVTDPLADKKRERQRNQSP